MACTVFTGLFIGHNGRWLEALNRAEIRRLPAVQPLKVANGTSEVDTTASVRLTK